MGEFTGVTDFDVIHGTWSFDVGSWTTGRKYTITTKGIYGANQEAPAFPLTFVIDDAQPTGAVTTPDNRIYLNSLPTLSGTADDSAPGTVATVNFRVIRGGDSLLWNWQASTFTAANPLATDLPGVHGAGTLWTYTTTYFTIATGTGTWERGRSYAIHEIVTDKAGNQQTIAHDPFIFEISQPTAAIVYPSGASQLNNLATISGTAADAAIAGDGNSKVEVAIYSFFDTAWFDNTNSFGTGGASPFWLNTSTSANATLWYYTNSNLDSHVDDGHQYVLLTRAINIAGSTQTVLGTSAPNVSSMTITIDKAGPTTTVSLPASPGGGAYQAENIGHTGNGTRFHGDQTDPGTNSSGISAVKLQLSYVLASDTYYWNQTDTNFSSWTVTASTWWPATPTWFYNTNVVWPTDMSHFFTLKVQAFDQSKTWDGSGNGNPGAITSTQFYVDIATPTASIVDPADGAKLTSLASITGTAQDDATGSGFAATALSIEISSGSSPTSYWSAAAGTWPEGTPTWNTVTLANPWSYSTAALGLVPDQDYSIRLKAVDKAGNTRTTAVTTFSYEPRRRAGR